MRSSDTLALRAGRVQTKSGRGQICRVEPTLPANLSTSPHFPIALHFPNEDRTHYDVTDDGWISGSSTRAFPRSLPGGGARRVRWHRPLARLCDGARRRVLGRVPRLDAG